MLAITTPEAAPSDWQALRRFIYSVLAEKDNREHRWSYHRVNRSAVKLADDVAPY